ncbi:hypothetical protein [Streptomyces seoulensis]|nr:hypothetical protein [Streptomyces seoulensis]
MSAADKAKEIIQDLTGMDRLDRFNELTLGRSWISIFGGPE